MIFLQTRFELKYQLTIQQYLIFKTGLLTFARKDQYSKTSTGNYFVRSLYYDNSNYLCYHDKIEGESTRSKLRFRIYNPVENKNKFGERMLKKVFRSPLEDYYSYLETDHFKTINPVLEEFQRMKLRHCFSPLVVIDYYREGFESKIDKKLRLTIDHGLTSYPSSDLFNTNHTPVFVKRDPIILEIKTNSNVPPWLMKLIKTHSLVRVSNSKYCLGLSNAYFSKYG